MCGWVGIDRKHAQEVAVTGHRSISTGTVRPAVAQVCSRTRIPVKGALPAASESSVFSNRDQRGANSIHVILCGFGTLDAGWACQQMLFQGGQLGFVFHHAEVVTFQVVIGDVVNEFHWLLH